MKREVESGLKHALSVFVANHRAMDERLGVGRTESTVCFVVSAVIVFGIMGWAFWYGVQLAREGVFDVDFCMHKETRVVK